MALTPTLFHEPWWLEIASAGRYNSAEVSESGHIVGRLPYMVTRRHGLLMVGLPVLTHFLGPAVDEGTGNSSTRFQRRLAITRNLISQLPSASFYYIKCHRDVSDVLAFQMERFQTAVQFTYEFRNRSLDDIWQKMRGKTRAHIRRGRTQRVVTMSDPAEFIHFYRGNLAERNISSSFDLGVCELLIGACLERGRGQIHAALDMSGRMRAASFSAWDRTTSYGLLSTRRRDAENFESSLLVWEAITSASQKGLHFDMDGISSDGSVSFQSGFGGEISPRYIVQRGSLLGELRHLLLNKLSGRKHFY
jgi:hypothetical protein